jgi:hypothetical protein
MTNWNEVLKRVWEKRRANGTTVAWNKGKKLSPLTEEHKKKLSLAHIGFVRTPEHNKKLMESKILHETVITPVKKGSHLSNAHKIAISKASIGKEATRKGENHWNWKGGVTPINRKIRQSRKYITWRNAVFERDNWTCQICGKLGCYVEADHIKPFNLFPKLRFVVDNGRTLCKKCHYKYGWCLFKFANPKLDNGLIRL